MGDDLKNLDVEHLIREVTELVVSSIGAGSRAELSPRGRQSISRVQARSSHATEPAKTDASTRAAGARDLPFALSASTRRPRNVLLLFPVPSPGISRLTELFASLSREGLRVRALGGDSVGSEAATGKLNLPPPGLEPLSATSVSTLLGDLRPSDAVVVGSLGFGFAGRLARLDDDDPFVRLVVSARLRGLPVLLLRDDLDAAAGVGGEIPRRAAELLREMERLGLEVLPSADLTDRLERASSSGSVAARGTSGLVTEDEVDRLHESGERRLVLPPRTLVTPLARSRAAELGLELIEKGAD